MYSPKGLFAAFLLLAANGFVGSPSAQPVQQEAPVQQETIDAFSIWSASGRMIQTRSNGLTFVGVVSGRLFIEEDAGPSDSGFIVCPVMIEFDTDSGDQSVSGKCTIATLEGGRAFAEIACTGTYAVGCDGELTLVGGAGHLDGVTGGGRMNVRNIFTDAELQAGNVVEQTSGGIAVWRDFQIRRSTQ